MTFEFVAFTHIAISPSRRERKLRIHDCVVRIEINFRMAVRNLYELKNNSKIYPGRSNCERTVHIYPPVRSLPHSLSLSRSVSEHFSSCSLYPGMEANAEWLARMAHPGRLSPAKTGWLTYGGIHVLPPVRLYHDYNLLARFEFKTRMVR